MEYNRRWGLLPKIGFRFWFSLFVIYVLNFLPNYLGQPPKFLNFYLKFWDYLTIQVGNYVLGYTKPLKHVVTGSGDTSFDWTNHFTFILLAVFITLIWSILDRKRQSYHTKKKWLLFMLSYYAGAYLLLYGIIKVFYLQFSPPNLERLFQTYGFSSPMRLMWTFMGSSETYTVFAGISEAVAGIFILFRRTRVLGALMGFGVMLNVFLMNMSYDIPVKLFSLQLMVMCLFVALVDYQRLLKFFVFNHKDFPETKHQPIFVSPRNQRILIGLQFVLLVVFVGYPASFSIEGQKRYGSKRTKPPMYGIYNVKKFVKNKRVVPPLVTDTLRWNRLLIDYPGSVSVMMMDNSIKRYRIKNDTVKKQMTFSARRDTVNKYVMKYQKVGKNLTLSGIFKKDTLSIQFENFPLKNFLLLNRGFHWVNEVPYNRYRPK